MRHEKEASEFNQFAVGVEKMGNVLNYLEDGTNPEVFSTTSKRPCLYAIQRSYSLGRSPSIFSGEITRVL